MLLVVVDHCSTWIHPVYLPPAPLLPLLTLPLPASLLPPFHSPSSFHLFLSCQVIHAVKTESPGSWKVLVVDDPALHILSACFKMPEVIEEGVTVVESINKLRKAIPDFHALYFCLPTKEVRTSFPPPPPTTPNALDAHHTSTPLTLVLCCQTECGAHCQGLQAQAALSRCPRVFPHTVPTRPAQEAGAAKGG